MKEIIVQLIGALGFIFLMWSYYKKKKIQILFMQILSSIIFTIHYYMLSGITGAICSFINIIVMMLIYWFEKMKKRKIFLILILIPFFIAVSLISWENIFSIFPILATILASVSFLCNKETTIRIIGIINCICWIIYGFIYVSYSGIIFNSITVVTTTIALIKNRK